MSVEVKNLAAFDSAVMGWFAAVEDAAAEAAAGLATRVFEKALIESPQYSGSYAANWKLSYGHVDSHAEVDPLNTKGKDPAPYERNSAAAKTYAMAHKQGAPASFKLGQSIFVSNSTVSPSNLPGVSDLNLAWEIENGRIKFRPVNQGADHVGARALNFVAHRYPTIGKSKLAVLRRVGV